MASWLLTTYEEQGITYISIELITEAVVDSAGFTERLYPEIAYLNRVGGCIHALGIAVESPQPLGEDLSDFL